MQTILVIDDDELVSRTLQRALKLYDYQVMVAHSGTEGLHLARRHQPIYWSWMSSCPVPMASRFADRCVAIPFLEKFPSFFDGQSEGRG